MERVLSVLVSLQKNLDEKRSRGACARFAGRLGPFRQCQLTPRRAVQSPPPPPQSYMVPDIELQEESRVPV